MFISRTNKTLVGILVIVLFVRFMFYFIELTMSSHWLEFFAKPNKKIVLPTMLFCPRSFTSTVTLHMRNIDQIFYENIELLMKKKTKHYNNKQTKKKHCFLLFFYSQDFNGDSWTSNTWISLYCTESHS